MLGTLTVFRMNWLVVAAGAELAAAADTMLELRLGWSLALALISSLTATLCLSLSRVRMVSTADTPLVYFSMKVSPSTVSSSYRKPKKGFIRN